MDYKKEIKRRAELAATEEANALENALITLALKCAYDVDRESKEKTEKTNIAPIHNDSLSEFSTSSFQMVRPLTYPTGELIEQGDVVSTSIAKSSSLVVERIENGDVYVMTPNKTFTHKMKPNKLNLIRKKKNFFFTEEQVKEAIRRASQIGEHGMVEGDEESIILEVMSSSKL